MERVVRPSAAREAARSRDNSCTVAATRSRSDHARDGRSRSPQRRGRARSSICPGGRSRSSEAYRAGRARYDSLRSERGRPAPSWPPRDGKSRTRLAATSDRARRRDDRWHSRRGPCSRFSERVRRGSARTAPPSRSAWIHGRRGNRRSRRGPMRARCGRARGGSSRRSRQRLSAYPRAAYGRRGTARSRDARMRGTSRTRPLSRRRPGRASAADGSPCSHPWDGSRSPGDSSCTVGPHRRVGRGTSCTSRASLRRAPADLGDTSCTV
jgi:hypothetical protein